MLHQQIDDEAEIVRANWTDNHARIAILEDKIAKEREDRIVYIDDHLNPIRDQLVVIKDGVKKEKKIRIANEKQITKQVYDDSAKMVADIEAETASRKEKMGELEAYMKNDL